MQIRVLSLAFTLRLVTQVLVLSQENPSMITKSLLILNLRRLENEKFIDPAIFEKVL